jgi:hypothetical protein
MPEYSDLPEGIQGGQEDYPLMEIAEAAEIVASQGGIAYQKFTCGGCGARLTIDEPNKFYTRGECDQCHFTTNLEETGCNFLAVFPQTEKGREHILGLKNQTPSD